MNDTLSSLLKLQGMDSALEDARKAKAALEPRRHALKAELQSLQASFEESRKSLNQAQLQKKALEGEVEAKDQAARKHTAELNAVKSNDAYKALLTEIENAKSEKTAVEDKILEVMETMDRLQKELKEREKTLAADKAALEGKVSEVDLEEKRLDSEIAEKSALRDAFFQSVPPEARGRYESVRRGRPGFAVLSAVKDMTCQGCRTKLPPDVVNSVMKGKGVLLCDTCSRILYIPTPDPQPASDAPAPSPAASA